MDAYAGSYTSAAQTDPVSHPSGTYVTRGGSNYHRFSSESYLFTTTGRYFYSGTDWTIGFRLALVYDSAAGNTAQNSSGANNAAQTGTGTGNTAQSASGTGNAAQSAWYPLFYKQCGGTQFLPIPGMEERRHRTCA